MFYREVPKGLDKLIADYKSAFSKPQFNNFKMLVSGMIIHDKKTIQEISDAFSKKDQSSLNRFATESEWDMNAIKSIRISQIKSVPEMKSGVTIIFDDSMTHKTGKKMEKAGYHRSGVTKKIEWGHCIVNSIIVGKNGFMAPLASDIYIRKKDCSEDDEFLTKREMALKQLDEALKNGFQIDMGIADCGYYSTDVCIYFRHKKVHFVLGIKDNMKISVNRKKRIDISEYIGKLCDKDYTKITASNCTYYIHTVKCSIRKTGTVKLIVSYKEGEEKEIKVYATDLLDKSNKDLMLILLKRWNIECFHRDAKQHLGLEDYQVRKYRGIQVVVLAVLVAYTLLVLSNLKNRVLLRIPEAFKRPLNTIGELCRFMKLSAIKGWNWIVRKFRDKEEFRKILNAHVLVKNAKV